LARWCLGLARWLGLGPSWLELGLGLGLGLLRMGMGGLGTWLGLGRRLGRSLESVLGVASLLL